MEDVYIHDIVDVPVIRKLAFLTERESNVKSFIAKLGNKYSQEIDKLMKIDIKQDVEKILYYKDDDDNKTVNKLEQTKEKIQFAHRYTRKIVRRKTQRALFSEDVADRVLNHKTSFKFD